MDARSLTFVAVVIVGCGADEQRAPSTQPAPVASDETPTEPEDRGAVPRCGAPEGASELTDFTGVEAGDGVLRWVAVNYRGSRTGWAPSNAVDMPMHHATRIAWTNLDDFEMLTGSHYEQLRFTFEVLSRDARPPSGEPAVVRVELRTRVVRVCSLSAFPSRAEGALLARIEAPTDACDRIIAEAVAAAEAIAACSQDTDCVVMEVSTCDLEGVGCYWHAANRNSRPNALLRALEAIERRGCPTADCDCPTPPTTARCVGGRCQAP